MSGLTSNFWGTARRQLKPSKPPNPTKMLREGAQRLKKLGAIPKRTPGPAGRPRLPARSFRK